MMMMMMIIMITTMTMTIAMTMAMTITMTMTMITMMTMMMMMVFTLLCDKFIQDTIQQISSESSQFYGGYDKHFGFLFWDTLSEISTNTTTKFYKAA